MKTTEGDIIMDSTGGRCLKENENKTLQWRDFPVVQWLRIHLAI